MHTSRIVLCWNSRAAGIALLLVLFCAAATSNSRAQTFTTLVTLTGPNGANPYVSLIQGSDGNFYGTTFEGGSSNPVCGPGYGCGTIYKITPAGNLTTVYNFCSQTNCQDGFAPWGSLVLGANGSFYGTTSQGGEYGAGTVFAITPSGTLTTLYSFQGILVAGPRAGLTLASDGNFYTTTPSGGTHGDGAIYKITPAGAGTVLYSFQGSDGSGPEAGLVQGTDGDLYGTTTYGGANNFGTVFKITLSGTLTSLHSFEAGGADGGYPKAALLQGTDGNFYGTTYFGGNGNGTVFMITPSGILSTLYSFSGNDGSDPEAPLIQANDGNFYGTTWSGGAYGFGTVFKITPAGILTTLHSFDLTDGGFPQAGLLQASNGILYGAADGNNPPPACSPYGVCGTVFSLTITPPTPLQFVPTMPCRVVDTRNSDGTFGGPPIQGGTYRSFPLPQGACGIPPTASAYSLNVTVVPYGALGYLTIWPTGQSQPNVSTMNSPDGRVKANAAVVTAGGNGAVSVYVTNTTNVILDIDGYFTASGSGTLQFYPLTPCRVVDTRQTNFPPGLGAPSFGNMETRELPVYTNSPCLNQLTVAPQAYSFNVTAVPYPAGQPLNYLTIWPSDEPMPGVSTLNNPTATVVANAAIVPADQTNGDVSVFTYNSTDVIIDVNGYFAAAGTGGYNLYPVAPCRAYDSRNNNGQPFMGERTVPIATSPCAPPANVAAYIFNATVVPSGVMPYLTLWPDMEQQPMVSTLNAYDGYITSNMAIVPNIDGSIDAYAAGLTQLILDISGYFAQ